MAWKPFQTASIDQKNKVALAFAKLVMIADGKSKDQYGAFIIASPESDTPTGFLFAVNLTEIEKLDPSVRSAIAVLLALHNP
jgi:hypothetical protein